MSCPPSTPPGDAQLLADEVWLTILKTLATSAPTQPKWIACTPQQILADLEALGFDLRHGDVK